MTSSRLFWFRGQPWHITLVQWFYWLHHNYLWYSSWWNGKCYDHWRQRVFLMVFSRRKPNTYRKSECYYVPDCKVIVIIPQRLFKGSTVITGEFIYNKGHAQLKFWDHPILKINYESKNHIPTATSRNAVIYLPSINLSVTYGKNQNLSPDEKFLLEWHFIFGHWDFCET